MRLPILHALLALLIAAGFFAGHQVGAADSVAAGQPTAREMQRQSARCRDLLRRSVYDFYQPGCLDLLDGGYLEDWKDGQFVRRGEKFLTLQARQLWFFSTMAAENIERSRSLEAAWVGYAFLDRAFRDLRQGGYISKTTDNGKPVDLRKHAYHNSFALYALVAYHQATRDREALRKAQDLFRVLDRRAYDTRHGGFLEFFYADWRPITDPKEPAYVGAIGTKTYNTHLHLMESFAALHRVWPDARLRVRLEELVRLNTSTFQHPEHRCNLDAWTPDWRYIDEPRNLRASYGHDIECLWLVFDAVRSLGLPEAPLRGWAGALGNNALTHGFDREHGGFFYSGPPGAAADDTRKEWWVQAEALPGLLELYRQTGNASHYHDFVRTLDFIEKHVVAPGGSWWATRHADGSEHANTSRSSMWQGAYHNGRALLVSAQFLSQYKPRTN